MADGQVTGLLLAWGRGDRQALDQLMPMVYGELRRLAGSYLRNQRSDQTLQPTALVHEAFLKLAGSDGLAFECRAQFFGLAAQAMRHVLVDHARAEKAGKRGGGATCVTFNEDLFEAPAGDRDVLALDDALKALAELDPRKAQIVEMRFFGGMTGEEIAAALGISLKTVGRDLRMAQAWLHREMAAHA